MKVEAREGGAIKSKLARRTRNWVSIEIEVPVGGLEFARQIFLSPEQVGQPLSDLVCKTGS